MKRAHECTECADLPGDIRCHSCLIEIVQTLQLEKTDLQKTIDALRKEVFQLQSNLIRINYSELNI